ncbi:MAG: stage II sporulation protein R [Eubacterium sp.]|nr:stage II sporulation protein R [Eubacterium sp.]
MNKTIKIFVPIFLLFLLISAYVTPFIQTSERISDDVFRLHILANSDNEEDQALKLKVRDAILVKGQNVFTDCSSLEEIINSCENNIDLFEKTARECIKNNGYDYSVKAYVDKEYFNTREYEEITLPSGIYNALKIEIGEAQGHNWWCVMFPAICLSAVSDSEMNNILDEEEIELINSDNKYEIRFKIVEIYEKIKSKLS